MDGQGGARQGCVGSLPRTHRSPDGSMHECHVSSIGLTGEAMSQIMGLVESTKITLDNTEDLIVDLSTELVEKDLQVEQMGNYIQELEDQVEAKENTIEVLED